MNNSKPITVMIVDDNDLDRRILERNLKKTELPLVLIEASSGEDAVNLLIEPREQVKARYPGVSAPVVLFLDINMPVMDGWDVLDALDKNRNRIEFNPAVVLMHTTSNTDWEKEKALGYQSVSDYVVKGHYTQEQLKQAVLQCRNEL